MAFHERARSVVLEAAEPDGIAALGGTDFRVKRNPLGEGCFVYFVRASRPAVWWAPGSGKAYPLNSPAKMVTPRVPWPRDDGLDGPSTSQVVDYVFAGKAMSHR